MNTMCETQFVGQNRYKRNSSSLSHHFVIFAQELGRRQELIILVKGDDGLRQLSEIQLQQRGHCVHICVTTEEDMVEIGRRGSRILFIMRQRPAYS